MPNYIENFGVEFLTEDEDSAMGFMGFIAEEGKAFTGYLGLPNLYMPMGDIDFFLRTNRREDGNLEVTGLDTHSCGNIFWKMRSSGFDLTPKGADPTEKLLLLNGIDENTAMVPVHLINGDLLPCFLRGELIIMQICALPLKIDYLESQQEYEDSQPVDKDGKKWLIDEGSLLPIEFLYNHSAERETAADDDFPTDDHVAFNAIVKRVFQGTFALNGKEEITFVHCIADTVFGELDFVHTIEQVDEAQRASIHEGAIITGVCVLSGDVAIGEYQNGIVRDYDHAFSLMRQVLEEGCAERLRSLLTERSKYVSELSGKIQKGPDDIINRLNYVHEKGAKYFAHAGKITAVDDGNLTYPVETRCIILASEEESNYESVAFLDVNENGEIERLLISKDSGYHFQIDTQP